MRLPKMAGPNAMLVIATLLAVRQTAAVQLGDEAAEAAVQSPSAASDEPPVSSGASPSLSAPSSSASAPSSPEPGQTFVRPEDEPEGSPPAKPVEKVPAVVEKTPADVPLEASPAFAPKWNCETDDEWEAWTVDKKEWCCQMKKMGCTLYCKEMSIGMRGWSQVKLKFCCAEYKIGCDSEASHGSFQCDTDGRHEWEHEWSPEKRAYCCDKWAIGCTPGETSGDRGYRAEGARGGYSDANRGRGVNDWGRGGDSRDGDRFRDVRAADRRDYMRDDHSEHERAVGGY